MSDRLRVTGLSSGYGGSLAVHDVSLRVGPSEVVALLGRNGAGKSTTLMTIAGCLPAAAGGLAIDGQEVGGWPAHRIARQGLSLVPQGRRIFPTLSVRENLTVAGRGGDLDAIHEQFPVLSRRASVPGSLLSGGEQQMLAIGRALMTRPRVLLMDEPSEGLAPQVVREIGEMLRRLRERSELSILIAEQNLALALSVADRVYVLERGHLVHEGSAGAFRDDRQLQQKFLGV